MSAKRSASPSADSTPAKIGKTARLDADFYNHTSESLARSLLGKVLVRILEDGTRLSGRIVDTEAYPGGEDQASHSHDGKKTGHNAALYMDPGTVYIHNTFGGNTSMYVTCKGDGASVMLRALEPLEGLDSMRSQRGKKKEDGGASLLETELCSGPAKLTQSLVVTNAVANKQSLLTSEVVWVEKGESVASGDIAVGHRIGVESHGKWAEKQWRFHIKNNPHVSIMDKDNGNNRGHGHAKAAVKVPEPIEIDQEQLHAKHRLGTDFYSQSATDLAQALLGKIIVRELEDQTLLRARIVDTAAFPGGEDEASHSHGGKRTPNNVSLYMEPGTIYIHNTFGGNVALYVSAKGEGASVMLRALEPLDGLKEMREARGKKKGDHGDSLETTDLCSGPAKLTQALHVNRADFNKQDLRACSYVWIEKDKECPKFEVFTSTRMLSEPHGEWGEKLWRYFIHGSAFLSVHEKEAKPQKQASHGHKPAAPLVPVEVNLDKIKAKHRLSTAFFAQSAQALSKALLGKVLVREEEDGTQMKCVIVETSAFPGVEDAASHSHDGQRTGHNAALYLEPGTIYIHNTFGGNCSMYICSEGDGAVAVHALEPRSGQQMVKWIHSAHSSSASHRASPAGGSGKEQVSSSCLSSTAQTSSGVSCPDGLDSTQSMCFQALSNNKTLGLVLSKCESAAGRHCEKWNLCSSDHMWLEIDESLAQGALAWKKNMEEFNQVEKKSKLRSAPTLNIGEVQSMYFSGDDSATSAKGDICVSAPSLKSRQRKSTANADPAAVIQSVSAPAVTTTSSTAKRGRKRKSTNVGPFIDSIKNTPRLTKDEFFDQPIHDLSKALLGRLLVTETADGQRLSGIIVETEGYPGGEDKASHSAGGKRTPRNEPMYMAPGTSYVYIIYGNMTCLNISSRGEGAAVLLRALEPREGKEEMRVRRGAKMADHGAKLQETDLCSGPAKLTQALGVKRDRFNKQDLRVCDFMWLEEGDGTVVGDDIVSCHRVGIDSHGEWAKKPWRYYIRGNHNVSQVDKTAEKAK